MKKAIMFGAVAGIVILAFGVVGFAYARTLSPMSGVFQQDADETYPYGSGMMGAGYGRGMMGQGFYAEGEGLLHDYMSQAIADEFGLTVEELEALHDSGETLWDYAQEQGISQDEFFSRMQAARTEALTQAVADEVITQEQADWMLDHMGQGFGFGEGGCHGDFGPGSFGRGMRGAGGRWNSQP